MTSSAREPTLDDRPRGHRTTVVTRQGSSVGAQRLSAVVAAAPEGRTATARAPAA